MKVALCFLTSDPSGFLYKESIWKDWIEENKDPEMKKFFNRYLDLKKDNKTMEMITEEIKLLMFNNKNLIDK